MAKIIQYKDKNGLVFPNSVVESGSNTNGNYIKFTDGSMICTKKVLIPSNGVNITAGAIFKSAPIEGGDYSIPFTGIIPTVLATFNDDSETWCNTGANSLTSFGQIRLFRATSYNWVYGYVNLLAIGRWK